MRQKDTVADQTLEAKIGFVVLLNNNKLTKKELIK